jgi:hypothetical protein
VACRCLATSSINEREDSSDEQDAHLACRHDQHRPARIHQELIDPRNSENPKPHRPLPGWGFGISGLSFRTPREDASLRRFSSPTLPPRLDSTRRRAYLRHRNESWSGAADEHSNPDAGSRGGGQGPPTDGLACLRVDVVCRGHDRGRTGAEPVWRRSQPTRLHASLIRRSGSRLRRPGDHQGSPAFRLSGIPTQ